MVAIKEEGQGQAIAVAVTITEEEEGQAVTVAIKEEGQGQAIAVEVAIMEKEQGQTVTVAIMIAFTIGEKGKDKRSQSRSKKKDRGKRSRSRSVKKDGKKRNGRRSRSPSGSMSRPAFDKPRPEQASLAVTAASLHPTGPMQMMQATAVAPQIVQQASMEVEAFLPANPVVPHAASSFRNLPAHMQRLVLDRGSLHSARDPSAVLLSRRPLFATTEQQSSARMPPRKGADDDREERPMTEAERRELLFVGATTKGGGIQGALNPKKMRRGRGMFDKSFVFGRR